MNSNQKEILERVLLMMNYDSSKTLNENTQLITEQYTWPTILQQGLKLSKNNTLSGPEWETYLNGLRATTLPDLMKIQKGFSDAGYGAISPDFGLQGFNKPNPTPASIVLENDIYVKSLKNYENRKSKGLNAGIKPTGPQSTLIPAFPFQMQNLFGKTSGQLLDELQKQKTGAQQNKTEQRAVASGCIFKNKTEGDAFREWFNNSYPKLAQKNQLERSGAFCNSYINKAANATFNEGMFKGKKVYDVYKDLTADLSGYNPKSKIPKVDITAQRDKPQSDASKFINQEKHRREMSQIQEKEYAEIFDFSKFPTELPLTQYNKTTGDYGGYEFNYWTEPNTKIKVYIQGKTKDEVFDELIVLYEEKNKKETIDKAYSNELINKLFTKEAIDYALQNCDEEAVVSFFEEIMNGTKKNKNGRIVGKYYRNSKGQSFMAKWDSTKIPCESAFWNEYGLYIQLGGMVAIAILSGGLGLGPSATIFLELAADTALNLYSLKKSVDAQDNDAIKMDLAYVFLPLLMASGPVRAALKSAKFGDEVIESVELQLKSLPPNATKTQVDDLLKNMTPQEQRVIKELGTEEYRDVVQKASKDVVDGIKKTAKAPIGRKISNPLINILVYGTPAVTFLVKKINDIFSQKIGKNINEEEQKLWELALSYFDETEQNKILQTLSSLDSQTMNQIKTKFESGSLGIECKKAINEVISGGKKGVDVENEMKKLNENLRKLDEEFLKSLNLEDEIQISDEPITN
jgi:hypothetical protein